MLLTILCSVPFHAKTAADVPYNGIMRFLFTRMYTLNRSRQQQTVGLRAR